MQSIELNIPETYVASPICSRRLMLLLLGLLRYSSLNILFTPFTKAAEHLIVVLSPILTYSSTLSSGDLYANIQIAAVHFAKVKDPFYQMHQISFGNMDNSHSNRLQFEETTIFVFRTSVEIDSLCIYNFHRSSHSSNDHVHLHDFNLCFFLFVWADWYYLLLVVADINILWFLHRCSLQVLHLQFFVKLYWCRVSSHFMTEWK